MTDEKQTQPTPPAEPEGWDEVPDFGDWFQFEKPGDAFLGHYKGTHDGPNGVVHDFVDTDGTPWSLPGWEVLTRKLGGHEGRLVWIQYVGDAPDPKPGRNPTKLVRVRVQPAGKGWGHGWIERRRAGPARGVPGPPGGRAPGGHRRGVRHPGQGHRPAGRRGPVGPGPRAGPGRRRGMMARTRPIPATRAEFLAWNWGVRMAETEADGVESLRQYQLDPGSALDLQERDAFDRLGRETWWRWAGAGWDDRTRELED